MSLKTPVLLSATLPYIATGAEKEVLTRAKRKRIEIFMVKYENISAVG